VLILQKTVQAENSGDHVATNDHWKKIPENDQALIASLSEKEEELGNSLMKSFQINLFVKQQLELMILQFCMQNSLPFEFTEMPNFFKGLPLKWLANQSISSLSEKKLHHW